MTQDSLQELVINSKYPEAIAALKRLQPDPDWQLQLTVLEGQYHSFIRDQRQGIIPAGESMLRENILRKHLLDLIQEGVQGGFVTPTGRIDNITASAHPVKKATQFRYWPWLAALVLCVGVAAYFIRNTGKQPDSEPLAAEKTQQTQPDVSKEAATVKPSTVVNSKPSGPPASSKSAASLPNVIQVTSTPGQYQSFFSAKASELMNEAGIAHQQQGNRYAHLIKCAFEVKQGNTQSGTREAFKYIITLKVEVLQADGKVCYTRTYYSKKPRIGYPEDSEDDLYTKILEPWVAEIKSEFLQKPPQLCKNQ